MSVVAVIVLSNGNGLGGFVGAMSDGRVITDNSWKCSSACITGWQNVEFDDSKWSVPYVTDVVADSSSEFPPEARWLWIDESAYTMRMCCRKSVGL